MATTKARITAYVDPQTWQEFREACLRRRISASRQLGDLLTAKLDEWKEEDAAQDQPTDD